MLLSMTGYGKSVCEYNGKKITIEVKSLNSKQIDISARLPQCYREHELDYRNLLAQKLGRGKIDLTIAVENGAAVAPTAINRAMVQAYFQQINELASELNLDLSSNHNALIDTILRLPDVMKTSSEEISDEEFAAVQSALADACENLTKFREQEGQSLCAMFEQKLENITNLLAEVEIYEKERIAKIRARLLDNLKEIESKIAIDHNRFEQELIFYIEKLDVSEEKVRLRNHIRYFRETMQNEPAAGKKMGFIAQEMGREINTLGSKSNHSEMQIVVVKMKDELEQIKEQVLNVL